MNSLHTSSLYLLKALHYLSSPVAKGIPLSLQAFQRLYEEDPDCHVSLSTDTLRLYLSALDDYGCKIERPSAQNNYGYTLQHHPFAMTFSSEEWIDVCEALNEQFSTTIITVFLNAYHFVEHLITLPYFNAVQKESLQDLLDGFLRPEQVPLVQRLTKEKPCHQVYFTYYQSKHQQHEWHLLHDAIVIVQRRVYWLCYRMMGDGTLIPLMLRLSRCRNIRPHLNADTAALCESAKRKIADILHHQEDFTLSIVMPKGMNVELPGLKQEQARVLDVDEATVLPLLKEMEAFYHRRCYVIDYSVSTLHDFYLRSRLKATGGFLIPRNAKTLEFLQLTAQNHAKGTA